MSKRIYPVCVIGGGAAGTMATLRTVLNNDDCLFFPGTPQDKKRSRAMWVRKVENMPAHFQYKKGIEEPNTETINWIQQSAYKEKLHLQKNTGVSELKKSQDGIFEIIDSKGHSHFAQFIILCTGIMDVQPHIQGSIDAVFDYANAQTIDYCLICDGHHVLHKKTAVLGHENTAAWAAIVLHERYETPQMSILTNGKEPHFQEDTLKLIKLYNIKVVTTPIKEIQGEEKGKILKGFLMEDGNFVEADWSFVSLGVIAYNKLATELGAQVDTRGYIITDEVGQTSVPGLYVAGDLKANSRKQIYTAWENAVSAVNAVNMKIRAMKREKLLSQFE